MSDELTTIVQRAQQADPYAQTELVQRYQTPALRVALTILSNQADAEDAVQDAWLLAIRKLHTLRQPEYFATWFYRIVANVALRKRQQRAALPTSLDTLETVLLAADDLPANSAIANLLPLAMAALTDKERMVINLHYFSGVQIA